MSAQLAHFTELVDGVMRNPVYAQPCRPLLHDIIRVRIFAEPTANIGQGPALVQNGEK
jgi:hypothetical protein